MKHVVLAIDPAKVSGWAVFVNGLHHSSGEGTFKRADRDAVVLDARTLAEARDVPIAVAMETWTPHGAWGFKQAMGVGEQTGRWLDSLEAHHVDHRLVRVQVNVWRRAVLSPPRAAKKAQLKTLAIMRARALMQTRRSIGDNEAEAVCMAYWACHAPAVRGLLRA